MTTLKGSRWDGVLQICHYCDRSMNRQKGALQRTWQHVLPRRRGGTNWNGNLKPCCLRCNEALVAVDDCPAALAAYRAVLSDIGKQCSASNIRALRLTMAARQRGEPRRLTAIEIAYRRAVGEMPEQDRAL